MKERLNRRRYAAVVRLLSEVLVNDRASVGNKLHAADRLLELHARHEAQQDRAVERTERAVERAHQIRMAELRAEYTQTGGKPPKLEPAEPTEVPDSAAVVWQSLMTGNAS